jgi:hypothetical protein
MIWLTWRQFRTHRKEPASGSRADRRLVDGLGFIVGDDGRRGVPRW